MTLKYDRKIFTDHLVLSGTVTTLIVILFAVILYFGGRDVYRAIKVRRSISQAEDFRSQKDLASAVLALQRALLLDPDSADAYRLLASMAEDSGSPNAINLLQEVIRLSPKDYEARIRLAQLALSSGMEGLAKSSLTEVPESARSSVAYHNIASALALKGNDIITAESHARTAIELAPENGQLRFNLATILLRSNNPEKLKDLNDLIGKLRARPEFQAPLYRVLTSTAVRARDYEGALQMSCYLMTSPNAIFSDGLHHLDLLQKTAPDELDSALKMLQEAAQENISQIVALCTWMIRNGMSPAASRWIKTLPETLQKSPALTITQADTLAQQQDWAALVSTLSHETWADLDFIRTAMIARALRETADEIQWSPYWLTALRNAGKSPDALRTLATVISTWPAWEQETTELLWRLSESPGHSAWALKLLHTHYNDLQDTAGIYRVASKLYSSSPEDPAVQNNYVVVSLLRNRNTTEMHAMAQELYDAAPTHPVHASTYALSLLLREKPQEASDVLAQLNPRLLLQPEIAAYYAACLKATGRTADAEPYLEAAKTAKLLPEEKAILADSSTE